MKLIKIQKNGEWVFIPEAEFDFIRKKKIEEDKLRDKFDLYLDRYYPQIREANNKLDDNDYFENNKGKELWLKFLFGFEGLEFKNLLKLELGNPLDKPHIDEAWEKDMDYHGKSYEEKDLIEKGYTFQINDQTKIDLINKTKEYILTTKNFWIHTLEKKIKKELKKSKGGMLLKI